jgi:hypothetical protein
VKCGGGTLQLGGCPAVADSKSIALDVGGSGLLPDAGGQFARVERRTLRLLTVLLQSTQEIDSEFAIWSQHPSLCGRYPPDRPEDG